MSNVVAAKIAVIEDHFQNEDKPDADKQKLDVNNPFGAANLNLPYKSEPTKRASLSADSAQRGSFGPTMSVGSKTKNLIRLGSDVFGNDTIVGTESHRGVMQKQCPSFRLLWQNRYFVLKHRMLRYYKTEEDYKRDRPPRGILNFQQVNF